MQIADWNRLEPQSRHQLLLRPAQDNAARVIADARQTIAAVRADGDSALRMLTQRFDGVALDAFEVTAAEFQAADRFLDAEQHAAIETAVNTVSAFHRAQIPAPIRVQTAPGVLCERISVPIRAVGLYVPAGSAPLPSTAIMLAVPAAIAQCPVRILCTPPTKRGGADAAVLVAARKAGVERIFKVGGAQAIAALAYGTASVPKCDKIFGPGNAWVTAAKLEVAADPQGAAFDLPAGVSEVMVIADSQARPEFVAADMLAQAEHSIDAQALLVTDSGPMAQAVIEEVTKQLCLLSRGAILGKSVANMRFIVTDSIAAALEVANAYAPEHLILEVAEPRRWLAQVQCAGAVFLGSWSPEAIGDYCGGPNHTLPTYGYARAYSGLCLEDFQKRITVQELTREGLAQLGPTAQVLAALEGLDAHAAAVTRRLNAIRENAS